jgi:hypothetical protein
MGAQILKILATCAFALSGVSAAPSKDANALLHRAPGPASLRVDLGYSIYEGYQDATSGLSIWKGYV